MPCGSCGAARARNAEAYVWTSADGTQSQTYTGKYAQVQASAKAKRKGGSYEAVPETSE